MEITIKRYSRKLTYEDAATIDEFWELAKRTERSLDREQRRGLVTGYSTKGQLLGHLV